MKQYSIFRGTALSRKLTAILILIAVTAAVFFNTVPACQASGYSIVILSHYNKTLKIGQSFYLAGVASNGKRITWKSSSARTASVNTYGRVTAKRAGICSITGKTTGGEASCRLTVEKTSITLSAASITMENGASFRLRGSTSNGSVITWRTSRSSVAAIDENGRIEAKKPGECTVTACADGTKKTCKVTVRKPKITLNHSAVKLYRRQTCRLTARVSSGRTVTWKSRKKSVAVISDSGMVTAKKHGTAMITAKVDGVTKECEVTVQPPEIKLNRTSITLKKGKTVSLEAQVSSGIPPSWKSSKSSIATVDKNGLVTARKKGSCVIYASEDGTKESCHITVTA